MLEDLSSSCSCQIRPSAARTECASETLLSPRRSTCDRRQQSSILSEVVTCSNSSLAWGFNFACKSTHLLVGPCGAWIGWMQRRDDRWRKNDHLVVEPIRRFAPGTECWLRQVGRRISLPSSTPRLLRAAGFIRLQWYWVPSWRGGARSRRWSWPSASG